MQDIDFMLLASMHNPNELRIVDDAKHPTMKKIVNKDGQIQGNIVYTTRKAAEYRLFDLISIDHKEEITRLILEKQEQKDEEPEDTKSEATTTRILPSFLTSD